MYNGARHTYNRLALDGFASLEVKLACDSAHFIREIERRRTRADVPSRSLQECYCSSRRALRTGKMRGFGTFAPGPSDAWERCPNRGVVSGSETIHRA